MSWVPVRIKETFHVVMSVPHSGSRTLMQWLAKERPGVLDEEERIGLWHFNMHPVQVNKFFEYANEEGIGSRRSYVPIRNPFDMADSWERRYQDATDKTGEDMCAALGLMFAALWNHGNHIELFRIEDLPVLKGIGPNPEGWEHIVPGHPRVEVLREFINGDEQVTDFYRSMYNDAELWWL